MAAGDRILESERRVAVGAVALSALVLWRSLLDIFALPKATLLWLAAIALVVLATVRAVRARRVEVPWTPPAAAAAAFAVAVLLAVVTAPDAVSALVGRTGRQIGGGLYLTGVVLFLVMLRVTSRRADHALVARALTAAAAPVTLYAIVQGLDADPFRWASTEGSDVFGTLGNANFLAGWLAIVLPLTLWRALAGRGPERIGAATVAVMIVAAALATGSVQGPLAAIAGVAVFVLARAGRDELVARARSRAGIAAGAVVVALGIAVLAGPGPFADARHDVVTSFEGRVPKWQTALTMGGREPVTGFGFGGYGDHSRELRPASSASRAARLATDAAHSVPLDLLASGGIPLLVTYLAFVATVGWALVRALGTATGEARGGLAALGGAWAAYQAQSLVSIDMPHLVATHWLVAGAIVGSLAITYRELPSVAAAPGGKQRRRRAERPLGLAALPIALVALVAVWLALIPIRASYAGARAERLANGGAREEALAAFADAESIAWWESSYPERRGRFLARIEDFEPADGALGKALDRNPRNFSATMNRARVAVRTDRVEDALAHYERAVELDPHDSEILAEVALYAASHGRRERAHELAVRAFELRPQTTRGWVTVGQALEAVGERDDARAAYRRALKRSPKHEDAEKGLERVS